MPYVNMRKNSVEEKGDHKFNAYCFLFNDMYFGSKDHFVLFSSN